VRWGSNQFQAWAIGWPASEYHPHENSVLEIFWKACNWIRSWYLKIKDRLSRFNHRLQFKIISCNRVARKAPQPKKPLDVRMFFNVACSILQAAAPAPHGHATAEPLRCLLSQAAEHSGGPVAFVPLSTYDDSLPFTSQRPFSCSMKVWHKDDQSRRCRPHRRCSACRPLNPFGAKFAGAMLATTSRVPVPLPFSKLCSTKPPPQSSHRSALLGGHARPE
jgi:hypothetical protein